MSNTSYLTGILPRTKKEQDGTERKRMGQVSEFGKNNPLAVVRGWDNSVLLLRILFRLEHLGLFCSLFLHHFTYVQVCQQGILSC
jgi:hypothetical protein